VFQEKKLLKLSGLWVAESSTVKNTCLMYTTHLLPILHRDWSHRLSSRSYQGCLGLKHFSCLELKGPCTEHISRIYLTSTTQMVCLWKYFCYCCTNGFTTTIIVNDVGCCESVAVIDIVLKDPLMVRVSSQRWAWIAVENGPHSEWRLKLRWVWEMEAPSNSKAVVGRRPTQRTTRCADARHKPS
jgi:hypothetical protein